MLITNIEAISYKYKTKISATTKPVKPQVYVAWNIPERRILQRSW